MSVHVEPHLQPLTGETFPLISAYVEDGARLDVASDGFWGSRHQGVFIDVKVFNPNAPSYKASSLSSLYHRLEKEKQRKYVTGSAKTLHVRVFYTCSQKQM